MQPTPFLLLMPSYNQAHFIVDTVRSILAQDDPDWQLWVVDNSSDNTPELMRGFDDVRIHYHHIPERMDPGACLNWMLARVHGRDFSYVHTDNLLHPDYVRTMRRALAGHPRALAYCDMRTIDERGSAVGILRRGAFDLPRLLSTAPLGVPFAATLELAKAVGGFSVDDLADDVYFCAAAYGLAEYRYVRQPLMDYRLHARSRTEAAGGPDRIQRAFLRMAQKVEPGLRSRGIDAGAALAEAVRDQLDDCDWLIEDIWYRKLSRKLKPWWSGRADATPFFHEGLFFPSGFGSGRSHPPRWTPRLSLTARLRAIVHFLWRKKELRSSLDRAAQMLLSWAALAGLPAGATAPRVRIDSLDFRTLWAARQLELGLGWQPVLDPGLALAAKWLDWPLATDRDDTRLDCRQTPVLQAGSGLRRHKNEGTHEHT